MFCCRMKKAGLCAVYIASALLLCFLAAVGIFDAIVPNEVTLYADEDISEAQKSVEKILKNFTVQDSIESIIKAKGFSECLCYISDEGVTVIVPDSELNDTSVLVINDSVTSHYDVSYEDISVVGV